MPRHDTQKPGPRHYRNYQSATLERVLDEIRAKKISVRTADTKYGILRNM